MPITGTIRKTVDLDHGVQMTPLGQLFASADHNAHTFEITLTASGKAVDVSGAGVFAYFIRNDQKTVLVSTGKAQRNVVTVTLPESCYITDRQAAHFQLIIKVSSTPDRKAVFWGDGYITRSTTDTIIDPGHEIPSLEELLAMVAEVEGVTTAARDATSKANTATTQANAARDAANTAASAANTAKANADAATKKANDAATAATTAKTNADAATKAANDAATAANTAKTNADAATKKANDAATAATTAKTNADAATTKANTAATNADTATGKANTATANANTATTNANNAANLIKNMTVTASKVAAGGTPTAALTKATSPDRYNLALGLVTGDTGKTGPAAGFGKITATVDDKVGTPSVDITTSGPDTAKNIALSFHNLKGIPGEGAVSKVWGAYPDTTGDAKPEVGGRNLALDTEKEITTPAFSTLPYGFPVRYNISDNAYRCLKDSISTTYTISVEAKKNVDNGAGERLVMFGSIRTASNTTNTPIGVQPDFKVPLTTEFVRYYATGHLEKPEVIGDTNDLTLFLAVNGTAAGSNSITVRNVKVEFGPVPTDWSPAPEDLETTFVGGRNLIPDSSEIYVTRTNTASEWIAELVPFFKVSEYARSAFKEGDHYTLSFDYQINNVTTPSNTVHFSMRQTVTQYQLSVTPSFSIAVGNNSGHYVGHVTLSEGAATEGDGGFLFSGFKAGSNSGTTVRLRNIKFERGNHETDWTPAPEDFRFSGGRNFISNGDFSAGLTTNWKNNADTQSDGNFIRVDTINDRKWLHISGPGPTQISTFYGAYTDDVPLLSEVKSITVSATAYGATADQMMYICIRYGASVSQATDSYWSGVKLRRAAERISCTFNIIPAETKLIRVFISSSHGSHVVNGFQDTPNDRNEFYVTDVKCEAGDIATGFLPEPTAADVGAVPTTRTVNGKALSGDISLTASDVGALASNGTAAAASKLATARTFPAVNLATTATSSFDGSKNPKAMGVSGTLPVSHGGTGVTSLTGTSGLIHAMFSSTSVTGNKYFPFFNDDYAAGGFVPSSGMIGAIGAVPATRTINSKALSSNISLTASDVGALASNGTATAASKLATARTFPAVNLASTSTSSFDGSKNPTAMGVSGTLPVSHGGTGATVAATALSNLGGVPATRKVNGKVLSGDITLSAADVDAVPASLLTVTSGIAYSQLIFRPTPVESNQIDEIDIGYDWTYSAPYLQFISGGYRTYQSLLPAYPKRLGGDCNNIATDGIYRLQGTSDFPLYNSPSTTPTDCDFYFLIMYNGLDWVKQLAFDVRSDSFYIRTRREAYWHSWKSIYKN